MRLPTLIGRQSGNDDDDGDGGSASSGGNNTSHQPCPNGNGTMIGDTQKFVVFCDHRFEGTEISRQKMDSLTDCANLCSFQQNPRCDAVEFKFNNDCVFITSLIPEGTRDSNIFDSAAGIFPQPGPTSSCSTLGSGAVTNTSLASNNAPFRDFELQCDRVMNGNDIEQQFQMSLDDCMGACAARTDCGGVSFDPLQTNGFNNCYLKTNFTVGDLVTLQGTDTALMVADDGSGGSVTSTAVNSFFTPTVTASTAPIATSPAAESAAGATSSQGTVTVSVPVGLASISTSLLPSGAQMTGADGVPITSSATDVASSTSSPEAETSSSPAAAAAASSNAWIAAPVIGGVAAVTLVLAVFILLGRRRRRASNNNNRAVVGGYGGRSASDAAARSHPTYPFTFPVGRGRFFGGTRLDDDDGAGEARAVVREKERPASGLSGVMGNTSDVRSESRNESRNGESRSGSRTGHRNGHGRKEGSNFKVLSGSGRRLGAGEAPGPLGDIVIGTGPGLGGMFAASNRGSGEETSYDRGAEQSRGRGSSKGEGKSVHFNIGPGGPEGLRDSQNPLRQNKMTQAWIEGIPGIPPEFRGPPA
ncbi:hypothetical protein F5Y15DRAFT_423363 [Xylariaceae sp. FL0016]|nr:hypothetical protein F5Y15DRAFT_423363 [Xylariaceae sp. FL0016]